MTLLTNTFHGIVTQNPDLLVPLFIIAGAFGISGIVGIGISVRDAMFRRS